MSMIKAQLELEQKKRMEAIDMAVEAGVLMRCDQHGEVYDPGVVDLQPAYILADSKFTRGEVYAFRDRREMRDAIQTVHGEAAMDCWQCEKLLDD